jgi:DNA-binding IclR family transcriptional regulator
VGASERDIAAATGVSPASTHADLEALRERGELAGEPETTRSRDGRGRPARQQPATAAEAKVERHGLTILMHEAWQRVAGCEDAGMTCLELEKRARWRHGRASSLLNRLERTGLVQRTGQFREDYGVYVARPLGEV